jgi:hypothetical protein
MPLQTSGAISLNDIHVEAGGASGTTASINDADIRALIAKASGATMSFSEWYGASAASLNTWPLSGLSTAPDPWGFQSYTSSFYAQVGCNYAQKVNTANDRLEHRWSTFNSGAPQTFTYAYQSYVGLDSATFEAKAVYSTTTSGQAGAASTSGPATNTWTTVSTSSYSPLWQWLATVSSGSGTRYVNGSVTFYMRASLSGTYYPNSSGYNSGSKNISLSATRGTQGPAGPGEP